MLDALVVYTVIRRAMLVLKTPLRLGGLPNKLIPNKKKSPYTVIPYPIHINKTSQFIVLDSPIAGRGTACDHIYTHTASTMAKSLWLSYLTNLYIVSIYFAAEPD